MTRIRSPSGRRAELSRVVKGFSPRFVKADGAEAMRLKRSRNKANAPALEYIRITGGMP